MNSIETLTVTSHVGRDLLASAASFKNEASAVWEYIVNSLQYVDEGVLPRIQVIIKPKAKIVEIRDNGRGMTDRDLNHFFIMHGENIDRLKGRWGRGKFGTGKSAAFGIGEILRVDTRRNGIRNVVELHRDDIKISSGKDIDLRWNVRNEPTDYPNGTTITIEKIFLKKINTQYVIEYVERHLQAYRTSMPEVAVNNHVCQYREPSIDQTFVFSPSEGEAKIIGNVELTIKVSTSPLPPLEQGVAITAGSGNLVAIETLGIEKKEMGSYLLGYIDVPALESYESPIEPYDTTRSLQLNQQHPVAQVLLPFLGSKLEEARRSVLSKLNEARKTEEARRLALEAQKIAEILNKDFRNVIARLNDIRSASARPGDIGSNFGDIVNADMEEGVWVEGTTLPGDLEVSSGRGNPRDLDAAQDDPMITRRGTPNKNGKESIDPAGGIGNKSKKPRGGFNVEYRSIGEDSDRSKYDKTSMTIIINLDNPVVANALKKSSTEDVNFKRLSYEIAFAEYSFALGYEMADQDPDIPADDLLYELRATLNRVSSSAAFLYS